VGVRRRFIDEPLPYQAVRVPSTLLQRIPARGAARSIVDLPGGEDLIGASVVVGDHQARAGGLRVVPGAGGVVARPRVGGAARDERSPGGDLGQRRHRDDRNLPGGLRRVVELDAVRRERRRARGEGLRLGDQDAERQAPEVGRLRQLRAHRRAAIGPEAGDDDLAGHARHGDRRHDADRNLVGQD